MDNFGLNVSAEAAQHIQALLGGLMSPNNEERGAAEGQYHNCKVENPDQMLATLLYLSAFSNDMPIRVMAALMFRKEVAIPSKEEEIWTWKAASPQAQKAIKAALLNILQQDHPEDLRRKLGDGLSSLAIAVLTLEDNSWPELLPFLLALSEKEKPEIRSSALEVLGAMANRIPEAIAGHFDSFIPFLQQKLADSSSKVRVSTFLFIYGLLAFIDEEPAQIQKLQTIGTGVLDAISACLHASDFESGSLGMEYLVEMVELCPKFLRPNIFVLIELMFKISKSDQLEDSIRHLAVEILVTLAESKPGMVRKIPNFMEGVVVLLLEWGVLLEENEDWNKGDEEDLEDAEAAVAEEAMDRLSIAMGGASMVPVLFSALPAFLSSEDWRRRHSGLIAISVVGEGSVNYLTQHLDKVVSMVLPFGQDPHPRVRWAAMNALGQMCTDYQPDIQVAFGKEILSSIVPVFDDKENPRVQSHAASAIVNFCEDCTKESVLPFLKPILEKLHGLLQAPRIVQEQVITAVAALADAVKEDFRPFYGYFMPFLKDVLNTATSKEYLLLRAKAMECASIIGVAVGKETFGQDAKEIIELLNKIEFASDPSMPSMHMAWARLCKCLGTDFTPYLEVAMPQLLQLAATEPQVEIVEAENMGEYEEGWEVVPLGDQAMCIKTSEAEDKSTAVNIIFCFADELGEHFFPYVQPVAQLMANSLTFPYHDAVRNTAASCCPCLLVSTVEHLKKTGQGMQPAVELWHYLQPQLLKAIRKEIDVEAHVSMLEAYSECFDLVGEATHTPESLKIASEAFNKVLKKYFDARVNRSKSRGEGEEDFDEYEAEKLENLIVRDDDVIALIAEMTGKLFKSYGPLYFPHFQPHMGIWKQFLQPGARQRDTQMAMCIFDDMTEHMREAAAPHVMDLFSVYGSLCGSEDCDIRQAAVFGVGLFAEHCGGGFGGLANDVAGALCQVITREGSRSEKNIHPTENAISALGKICLYQGERVDLPKFIGAFVSFLPVCADKEESPVTYGNLCELLDKYPLLVLGGDNWGNLPSVLRVLGGVLGSDLVSEKVSARIVASIKRVESANQERFREGCGVLGEEEREKIIRASNM